MTDENKIYVLTDNQESKRIYLEILNSQFIGLKNKEIKFQKYVLTLNEFI